MNHAMRIDDLTRTFGPVTAVRDLSMEVPAGAIFGFLGPNGAGKTTTIHLLLGLLEPTSGRAEVLGLDSHTQGDEIRARTGCLLEHHGLYEQLSARENLEFAGRAWHMPAAARDDRIRELLTGMDLWDRRDDRVGTWSRGMKQRLALARSLLHRPALVFLDEPTAGLDVVSAAAVREELVTLVEREGTTVFLTTHNMSEAERLCGEVAVIRGGELLALGAPDRLRAGGAARVDIRATGLTEEILEGLRSEPGVSGVARENGHLRVDLEGDVAVPSLVSRLVDAGARVEEVRQERASLEEVFLTLMAEEGGVQ